MGAPTKRANISWWLATGRYTLRVQKEGFQTEVREGIALSPGAAIGINLSLVVGKLSVHATVEAGVPSVDITTTTVEGMIAERSLNCASSRRP